jgi:hypothetical protein
MDRADERTLNDWHRLQIIQRSIDTDDFIAAIWNLS